MTIRDKLLVELRAREPLDVELGLAHRLVLAARLGLVLALAFGGGSLRGYEPELPDVPFGPNDSEDTHALSRRQMVAAATVAMREVADNGATADVAGSPPTADDRRTEGAHPTRIVTHVPQDGQRAATLR